MSIPGRTGGYSQKDSDEKGEGGRTRIKIVSYWDEEKIFDSRPDGVVLGWRRIGVGL